MGHPSCLQLTNAGDDVVVFYNDKASLAHLLDMMKAARDGVEDHSPLMYHISLVDLLAACAEGKNVYTEIKCTSLLPLEDVVSVVTHEDCITEVLWGLGEVAGVGGDGRGGGRVEPGRGSLSVLPWQGRKRLVREVGEWQTWGLVGGVWGEEQRRGQGRIRVQRGRARVGGLASAPDLAPGCAGENGLRELRESLLRGHRGGDEGDLHQQPHLDTL